MIIKNGMITWYDAWSLFIFSQSDTKNGTDKIIKDFMQEFYKEWAAVKSQKPFPNCLKCISYGAIFLEVTRISLGFSVKAYKLINIELLK